MHSRLLSVVAGVLLIATASGAETIMETDDNAAQLAGTWTNSKATLLWYGDDYAVAQGGGTADVAIFTAPRPSDETGTWCVDARWTAAPNRSTAARYRIYDGFERFGAPLVGTVNVNQRVNGGAWQRLACVPLTGGVLSQVLLDDSGVPTGNFVVADAVRWVKDGISPGIEFHHDVMVRNLSTIVTCTGSVTTLDSVTLTLPAAGFVLVQTTGEAVLTTALQRVVVGIQPIIPGTGDSDVSLVVSSGDVGNAATRRRAWSLQRVYPVTGPGTQTFSVTSCRDALATGSIIPSDLVATYFPKRY